MMRSVRMAAVGLLLAGLLGAAPAALAQGKAAAPRAPLVRVKGPCSLASIWKLQVKHDGALIETDFEVRSGVIGQRWNVGLADNGTPFFSGARRTKAPDGSFDLRKLSPNLAGPDTITASATNPTTGETCSGQATV